jgi:hypothetical protein
MRNSTLAEGPPTSGEVELYYTARHRLSPERLKVLNVLGAKFPHAEVAYQAHVTLMAETDMALEAEIRARRTST